MSISKPTRFSMTLTAGLGLVLVGALVAWPRPRSSEAQPTPAPAPAGWNVCQDLDPRAGEHACPNSSCGSNSPYLNLFPLNGVHPGACVNAGGRRLVAGSLQAGRGRCPAGAMTLDADAQGRLVGRNPTTGAIVCQGVDLVGAVFTVEATRDRDQDGDLGPPFATPRPAQIMISQMGTIVDGNRQLRAYVFSPENDPARSLCDATDASAWMDQWLSNTTQLSVLPHPAITADGGAVAVVNAAEQARYAILIGGDLFDRTAAPLDRKGAAHWFNIACADGALAKSRIRGLDDKQTPLAERMAALKMLTAKYRDGISHTMQGVAVEWKRGARRGARVEARWGENGATCLSHSRLWRANTAIPAEVLGNTCLTFSCDESAFVADVSQGALPACSTQEPPPEKEYWTSYVVDHVDH